MILESAALGGVLGGLARLAPEILKVFDRRYERKHELEMTKLQIETIKVQGHIKLEEADVQTEIGWIDALKESVKSQATKTGIRWVDALSASVRPVITYWYFGLYAAVKIAGMTMLARYGADWSQVLTQSWGPDDVTNFSAIMSFWFMGRVFERRRR